MARLTEDQKRFIVCELAAFSTPTQVVEAFKERFGVEVGRSHIHAYDPTGSRGPEVAKKWQALFEKARKRFLEDTSDIPISHKAYRLKRYDRIAHVAEQRGNVVLALDATERAAKEMGGVYTNRREFTGKGGEPLSAPSAVVILPAKEVLETGGGDAKG